MPEHVPQQWLTDRRTTRRSAVRAAGATMAGALTASLAGCVAFGADHASYWSESRQLEVNYDAVMAAARDAGYEVEEPYYVGTREARGLAPEGITPLDQAFGPAYRVFGFSLFHTDFVFIECWVTGDDPSVSLFDERVVVEEFPIESVPPEAWFVDRLTLAFDVSDAEAREYAAELREQAAEGTDVPRIDVSASVTFHDLYAHLESARVGATGSETGGDGWYKETSIVGTDDGPPPSRLATIDFIVQSMEIRRRDGDRTYTMKIDRLGGFYLRIRLPVGEEIPEPEYRDVFRELFEDVGLPPEVVDDLPFEYEPSIW